MSYIFLSFSKHLDKASNSKNEFYKLSLNDQFNLLQKRIPLDRHINFFQKFIEECFPSGFQKKILYFLSVFFEKNEK